LTDTPVGAAPNAPTTWVLLRGLTREARHWGEFPDRLREQLPGARIVLLDLPGNGELSHWASPWRVEAMAEHCRAELARRGEAPPFHVLAMSLGAMVAVAWAQQHPRELAGCVLINTSLRPFSPFYQRLRPRNYPTLLRLALGGMTRHEREKAVLRLTSTQCASPEAVLERWVSIATERPVSASNAVRQLWAATRFIAPPLAPEVPVLLLAGARDALVAARCSVELARRWQTDIAIHCGRQRSASRRRRTAPRRRIAADQCRGTAMAR
jgi:pimeloyl-ACP methyl ester carboxylesterase